MMHGAEIKLLCTHEQQEDREGVGSIAIITERTALA